MELMVGVAATAGAPATAGLFGMGGSMTAMGALSGISTVASIFSGMSAAEASAQQSKLEGRRLELEARSEEVAGRQERLEIRDQMRRTMATNRATYAARGIRLDSLTPEAMEAELRTYGARQLSASRFGSETDAEETRMRSDTMNVRARSQRQSGLFGAIEKVGSIAMRGVSRGATV